MLNCFEARKISFSEARPLQVDGIGIHVMYWFKCTWHLAMYVTPWGKLRKTHLRLTRNWIGLHHLLLPHLQTHLKAVSPVHLCLGGMIKTQTFKQKKVFKVQIEQQPKKMMVPESLETPTPATLPKKSRESYRHNLLPKPPATKIVGGLLKDLVYPTPTGFVNWGSLDGYR